MNMQAYKKDYTTKEAALMLGVHRDTIMYWEENQLIPPARRNPKNNYRIYSTEEILEIARIREIGVVDVEAVERDKSRRRAERNEAKRNQSDLSFFVQ
jgi:DNA-binding transcriptional MerR regulator